MQFAKQSQILEFCNISQATVLRVMFLKQLVQVVNNFGFFF